ncbi:sulfhydryl oxidase 1-like [Sarcoptes scabiei]|nr:sulfhydryl oxidase 1-like [Sarcoptes scabiei]
MLMLNANSNELSTRKNDKERIPNRNNPSDKSFLDSRNLRLSKSRIPIYLGNNNDRNNQQILSASRLLDDLYRFNSLDRKLSTDSNSFLNHNLPASVRINQNLHNRLNHSQHTSQNRSSLFRQRPSITDQIRRSVPSTPASIISKLTDETCSSTMSNRTSKSTSKKKKSIYDDYLPLCEMQKGMKRGEIIEGILRINPRNYNDAYISAPDQGLDIYIKSLIDRNRALNGDTVAVKLYDAKEWTISYTDIDLNWDKWKRDFDTILSEEIIVDLNNLKLNSKDSNKLSLGMISSPNDSSKTKKDLIQGEFQNLPLKLFMLDVEILKANIPYWPEFIQRTGKVVRIIERNHSLKMAGSLHIDMKTDICRINSRDIKIPPVIIPSNVVPGYILQKQESYKNHLFLATISDWPVDSLYPKGEIIKVFEEIGDVVVEHEVCLMTLGIDSQDFPDEVIEEYQASYPNDWKIPLEEFKNRKDLRNDCVFTIDPETAKDLDDAVSFRAISQNLFEIGIHIADVSYFIQENSKIDAIAKDRATSVYLVHKVIPMLPHIFSQNLCSLNPNEDKLTLSIIFKIDSDGEIHDRWIGRTIINSCCKLNYEIAQVLIELDESSMDDRNHFHQFPKIYGKWTVNDIGHRVRCLNKIARKLREKRFKNNSLYINKKKIYFLLGENNQPIAMNNYQLQESNYLIEELMLLANKYIAKFIFKKFAKMGMAFLRKHASIDFKSLNNLMKPFQKNDILPNNIDSIASILNASKSLKEDDPIVYKIFSTCLIKSLKLAEYVAVDSRDSASSFHHFALNFDKYTHFTSPIRRYADVVVHRLLCLALGYSSTTTLDRNQLKMIAKNCNTRKYNAFLASEKSSEIYLKAYLNLIGSFVCEAVVFNVYDHSFDVIILDFDLMQRIYTDKMHLENSEFVRDHRSACLKLYWKPIENGPQFDRNDLEQTITRNSRLKVELKVNKKFEMKAIIAHPNGTFIHLE